jgi:CRP/FNR family cyclic AMP-dependent transcriptional regulator
VDIDRLRELPLFADFSKKQLRLFARHADELSVSAGRVLMREGDMAMEVCIVLEGEAEATSGDEVLSTMGPGSVIGEIGVLEGLHRTATVTAVTDMKLAVVFGPEFTALADDIKQLEELLQMLIDRRMARGGGDPS